MNIETEVIWNKFSNELTSFIKRRVRDKHHSEDILQDIFLKIHSNIHTLEDNSKIRGWIYQIARNTLTDFYRKQIDTTENSMLNFIHEEDIHHEADEVLSKGIKSLISLLPQPYQQALIYTEYNGYTQHELAKVEGISIPTAKSRVQRARNKLKSLILHFCHIEFDKYGTVVDYYPINCNDCKKIKKYI